MENILIGTDQRQFNYLCFDNNIRDVPRWVEVQENFGGSEMTKKALDFLGSVSR